MKHQKLRLLFYFTALSYLMSCIDSKSEQNLEVNNLSEEQYDFLMEKESYQEENNSVEFTTPMDVMSYLSDKNFRSPDGLKVIHIGYDGVSINGTPAYFNLDIIVEGRTTAYIKGQSLNNPNGIIDIRIDSDSGCIYNDGTYFCL